MMKHRYNNGLFSTIVLAGIIISLVSLGACTHDINSTINGVINPNIISSFPNNHNAAPVSTNGIEYIYLTEVDNVSISKTLTSSQNVIPIFSIFFCNQAQNPYQDKYTYFPDSVLGKALRQICRLLDLPPPPFSCNGLIQFKSEQVSIC